MLLLQTKNAFEVKADLPGVEKSDIKVNVDGDVLTISHEHAGKKEDKKEQNGVKYHVSLSLTPSSLFYPQKSVQTVYMPVCTNMYSLRQPLTREMVQSACLP